MNKNIKIYVNPDKKTCFDKSMISGVILNLMSIY